MPISSLLGRFKTLIPRRRDHCQEVKIARSFKQGVLRAPPKPMSDRELSRAIGEFLRKTPTTDSAGSPDPKIDPPSRK